MNESSSEDMKYISDPEIKQVPCLLKKNQQRIYRVSVRKKSRFAFCVPYRGHYAFAEVLVCPFNRKKYPCFDIAVQYQPCCTRIDQDADVHVKSTIQGVYDTYIRPIWRRLDDNCTTKLLPQTDPLRTCRQKKIEHTSKWTKDTESGRSPQEAHELTSSNLTTRNRHQNSSSSALPGGALPSTCKNDDQSRMLVNEIVKRLRKGKDDISGRKNKAKETTGFHKEITGSHKGTTGSHEEARPEDPIRDAVLGLTVNQKGDPRTILMELEKGFDQVYYDLMHQKTWLPWYFAGCFSLCQHRLGLRKSKQPLDRRANGVQVLHRIVNNCIDTHGIRGLMVLCSAAEEGFKFSRAGHLSEVNIGKVCQNVAEELELNQLKLSASPQVQRIPCPTVWISHYLPQISHQRACFLLGIPELGRIPLEPVLIDLGNGNFMPEQTYQYSFLEERWRTHAMGEELLPSQVNESGNEVGKPDIVAQDGGDVDRPHQQPHLEAPQNESPLPTEGVESPSVPSEEAESENHTDGTSSTTSNGTTSYGHEDCDSEPGEGSRKRRRLDGACTDNVAVREDVDLGMSLPDALILGDGTADQCPNFDDYWAEFGEDMPIMRFDENPSWDYPVDLDLLPTAQDLF